MFSALNNPDWLALKPRERTLVMALLTHRTYREAARELKLTEDRIYDALRKKPIKNAYLACIREATELAMARLASFADAAVDQLAAAMAPDAKPMNPVALKTVELVLAKANDFALMQQMREEIELLKKLLPAS